MEQGFNENNARMSSMTGIAFSKDVIDQVNKFTSRRGKTGSRLEMTKVPVSKGYWLKTLAEELFLAIPSHRRKTVTVEELEQYLFWLMEMRVLQVNRVLDRHQEDEVRVLSVVLPMLAAVGEYENPTAHQWLMPTVSRVDGDSIDKTKDLVLADYNKMNAIARDLEGLGFEVALGLPCDCKIDRPDVYKIFDNDDSLSMPFPAEFNPELMVTRLIYKLEFISRLFGEAGTEYLVLQECRSVPMKLAIASKRRDR